MKVAIIGGGISGVSVAFKLSKLKDKGVETTLFESSSRLGGTIETVHKDGYDVEAGTNGFLNSKPFTLDIFTEAGLSDKLVRSEDSARKRFIQRNNKLVRLPETGLAFLKSPLISFKGKIRLAIEFFVKKGSSDDESLADFIKRRLGVEALDYLISPMVSGIFAGNPEKMSINSSFPVIKNLEQEYGGLIKSLLSLKRRKKGNKKAGPGGPGGILLSYEGGMGEAVKDLAKVCVANGVDIKLSSSVDEVSKKDDKFIIKVGKEKHQFDKVIVTSPAYCSSVFLDKLDKELSETLLSIPYSPIFVSGLGYNNSDMDDSLNGFGYLIPTKEGRDILGALFTSSMFPAQAPKGKKFLRVLTGGDTKKELMNKTDDELLAISIKSIKDILGVHTDPYFTYTFRYDKAIPQYYVGHGEKVAKIESACSEIGGIYIGGNVLYGIGLNDCTKQSTLIAEKIEAEL